MWQFVVLAVLMVAAAYALAPKPQSQPPPGIGEIKAPTAEEGREIPVLFGSRDIRSANIVWYGDLDTEAIKVKGGKK